MKFFSGSSNKPLAQLIAQKLNISLGKVELLKFNDREIKPVVKENVRDEVCVVLQSTTIFPNDYWMELFLLVDALKREAAKKVIAVIPNFGYARQNQKHQKGEPVSAHVLVKFLETVGVSEVITVDLHDETMTGMFDIPINNISALPILGKTVQPLLTSKFVVAAPDQGGIERARMLSESLKCPNAPVIVEKKRNLAAIHESTASQVLGEVKGLTVVLQDDVITSGGTVLNAIEALSKKGAGEIYVLVSHQDFASQTAAKLKVSRLTKMFITNSVVTSSDNLFPKLSIVDISGLLASAITRII